MREENLEPWRMVGLEGDALVLASPKAMTPSSQRPLCGGSFQYQKRGGDGTASRSGHRSQYQALALQWHINRSSHHRREGSRSISQHRAKSVRLLRVYGPNSCIDLDF